MNSNQNTKNNIVDDVDSFDSTTSEGIQQGGFFWSSNGNINNDNKLLLAAEQGNNNVVQFMIENSMYNNIQSTDTNGKNILHHLSKVNNSENNNLIEKVLALNSSSDFINKQDNQGNTPIHCSVLNNNMSMCQTLIESGGNKKIKNNEGLFVETTEDRSDFSENIQQPLSEKVMEGGREKVVGERKNKFLKENRSLNSRVSVESRELAKLLQNQASEIHDRVKNKIMEIMKVSQEEMKYIKAAIYQWVKKNNPDLSNLDRAVEMEKNTNKEFIEKLKKSGFLDETKKAVEQHYKNKEKNPKKKDMKEEKKPTKKVEKKAEKKTVKKAEKKPAKKAAKKAAKKPAKKTTKKKKGGYSSLSDTDSELFKYNY